MNQSDENIACDIQFRALMHAVVPKRSSSNIPVSFYLIWQTNPSRIWVWKIPEQIKKLWQMALFLQDTDERKNANLENK